MKGTLNPIELWKAIHGGCWPGPPVDQKFNQQVNEVVAGLALFNLSNTFAEARVAQQARALAAASLSTSLTALQRTIGTQARRGARGSRRLPAAMRRRQTTLTRDLLQT